jgi:hypothetical protein
MSDSFFRAETPRSLSEAGKARQAAILGMTLRAGAARRRRRITMTALAITAPLLLAAAVPFARLTGDAPDPAAFAMAERAPDPAPPARSLDSRLVETDPAALSRHATGPYAGRGVVYITDQELSEELARAGHDPGVIRTPGAVIVTAAREIPRPPG